MPGKMDGPADVSAERVKELRKQAGLSQQGLATAAGLSMSVVAQIEQGKRPDPQLSTALALARALGVTVEDLLEPPAEKPRRKKPKGGGE